jgi:hypothetical protein
MMGLSSRSWTQTQGQRSRTSRKRSSISELTWWPKPRSQMMCSGTAFWKTPLPLAPATVLYAGWHCASLPESHGGMGLSGEAPRNMPQGTRIPPNQASPLLHPFLRAGVKTMVSVHCFLHQKLGTSVPVHFSSYCTAQFFNLFFRMSLAEY